MNKLGIYKAAEKILNTVKSIAKGATIIIFLRIIIPPKVSIAAVTDHQEKKL